jgi:hypothetical protein
MDLVSFNSENKDIAEAVRGAWGKEVTTETKIVYCGQIVFAIGKLDDIKKQCKQTVYDWISIGSDAYMGVIQKG